MNESGQAYAEALRQEVGNIEREAQGQAEANESWIAETLFGSADPTTVAGKPLLRGAMGRFNATRTERMAIFTTEILARAAHTMFFPLVDGRVSYDPAVGLSDKSREVRLATLRRMAQAPKAVVARQGATAGEEPASEDESATSPRSAPAASP